MVMRLKFYTDTHISKQVALQLRQHNVDVLRCEDVDMAEVDDITHLTFAATEGRVLITKDEGFIKMHLEWQEDNRRHSGIFYCPYRDRPMIGLLVRECLYYVEVIESGAGTIENDIVNQLFYIT